jgi:hypothetical protein
VVIAVVAAALGAALWFYSTAPYAFLSLSDLEWTNELKIGHASQAAGTLGILAAGYAFLAYRGLANGVFAAEDASAGEDDQRTEL